MDRRGRFSRARPSPRPLALAGCGGVPKGTKPDVPGENAGGTAAAAATSRLSSTAPLTTRSNGLQSAAASKSFAKANSIPFPVAVGNTWVYQTTAGGATGRTTNRIVAADLARPGTWSRCRRRPASPGPAAPGRPATSSTRTGRSATRRPRSTACVAVTGGGIRWPNAAALARPATPTTRRCSSRWAGPSRTRASTSTARAPKTVTVPAGTYQASVVETTIAAKGETIEVTTSIAQGVGTVRPRHREPSAGLAGRTTQELLSFTKVSAIGDSSLRRGRAGWTGRNRPVRY